METELGAVAQLIEGEREFRTYVDPIRHGILRQIRRKRRRIEVAVDQAECGGAEGEEGRWCEVSDGRATERNRDARARQRVQ